MPINLITAAYFSKILSRVLSGPRKKVKIPSRAYKTSDNQLNESQELPLPIVYGYNKVCGTVIYREQTDSDVREIAYGLCEGEIEGVEAIQIDGIDIGKLVKKKLGGITFAFHDNGGGNDTITDSDSNFNEAGFLENEYLIVYGSKSNDGHYKIISVSSGTIEVDTGLLTEETAGEDITLTTGFGYKVYRGTPTQLPASVFAKGLFTINVSDDAYVWSYEPDTNFGLCDENGKYLIQVGRQNIPFAGNESKYIYLKFDFSEYPADLTVTKSYIRLFCLYRDLTYAPDLTCFSVDSEAWTQGTITWNNKPNLVAQISDEPKATKDMSFQVFKINAAGLTYLQTAYNSHGTASIAIRLKDYDSAYGLNKFSCIESTTITPYIRFIYSGGNPGAFRNTAYVACTIDYSGQKVVV